MHMHVQLTVYPAGTVQPTRAQPAHTDLSLDSCSRYPSLQGSQPELNYPRLLILTSWGIELQTSCSLLIWSSQLGYDLR